MQEFEQMLEVVRRQEMEQNAEINMHHNVVEALRRMRELYGDDEESE